MKDGNVAELFESCLDFKATRARDVFKIYAAETRTYIVNGGYDLIDVLRFYADGDRVDSCKFVKQYALAFHNGHTRFRTCVAKPQNSASVRDYGNRIPTSGERVGQFGIVFYRKAGGGNSRRICKRQVLLVLHFCSRSHFQLAFPLVVFL